MARRRRMHRKTRSFVLALSAFVACAAVAFVGLRWLCPSKATMLTGWMAPKGTEVSEPTLKPIVAPLTLAANTLGEPVKPATVSQNDKPTPQPSAKPDAKPQVKADGLAKGTAEHKPDPSYTAPIPPTTQPSKTSPLPAGAAKKEFDVGMDAKARNDLIVARTRLNTAMHGGLTANDMRKAREALTEIADETIFKPHAVVKGDPLVHKYTVKTGDSLARIARRYRISEDFLTSINKLPNKNIVRLGSSMKVVDGPFSVAVVKKDHLMHVYLQDVYLKSFRVALGTGGGTPTGLWKIANHLENPGWTDPRTGHRWHPDDPANPIGEFWIGLQGIEGECVGQDGFGIHGTIEENTIGQDVSLGCVRLAADDIAFAYKLLVPGQSMAAITE